CLAGPPTRPLPPLTSTCQRSRAYTPLSTCFFFNQTATTDIYTLSLHDALPISLDYVDVDLRPVGRLVRARVAREPGHVHVDQERSEEHTSELQSLTNLVCRLLLEKKKCFTFAKETAQQFCPALIAPSGLAWTAC